MANLDGFFHVLQNHGRDYWCGIALAANLILGIAVICLDDLEWVDGNIFINRLGIELASDQSLE